MSHIRIHQASKSYAGRPPVTALDAVDLEIPAGSLAVVLGESGSGKTTLLRAIAGFERLDSGTIEFSGQIVSSGSGSVPPERRRVAIVPQEGALFPHLTVAANVAYGLPRARRRGLDARVAELLEMVGLGGLGERSPHQLSGGQQQRVAVARALAPDPAVVLLDEPFAALDTTLRTRLRADVAAALRAAGATALLVTHDPAEAMAMADRLAVMRNGRVVQVGSVRDVYLRPVDEFAARALGDVIVLDGSAEAGVVDTPAGPISAPDVAPGRVRVFVRPEQIQPADQASVDGRAVASIETVEFQGADVLVSLAVGELRLRTRWPASAEPVRGTRTGLRLVGAPLYIDRPDSGRPEHHLQHSR